MKIGGIDNSEKRIIPIERISNNNNNSTNREKPSHIPGNQSKYQKVTYQKPFSDFLRECGVSENEYWEEFNNGKEKQEGPSNSISE